MLPFWGWVLIIACLSAFLLVAIGVIIHATHRRLPEDAPLHGDPTNFAAPLPIHIAEADSMTARELEAEAERVRPEAREGGAPPPRGTS